MGVFDLRKYRAIVILLVMSVLFFALVFTVNFTLEIIYPLHYESVILKYSNEYDLDFFLVASVIRAESKYDPYAVSPKGAKGLMQIASITGNWASKELNIEGYSEEMLFDPDINIKIGCWYINKLKKEFNNNMTNVLAAYNAGSGNVSKWLKDDKYCPNGIDLEEIPFGETKRYVVRVNKNYKIYNYLYGE